MNEQKEFFAPQSEKVTIVESSAEELREVQNHYGIYKPLVKGSDGQWYLQEKDTTLGVSVETFKKEMEDLDDLYQDDRKDLK